MSFLLLYHRTRCIGTVGGFTISMYARFQFDLNIEIKAQTSASVHLEPVYPKHLHSPSSRVDFAADHRHVWVSRPAEHVRTSRVRPSILRAAFMRLKGCISVVSCGAGLFSCCWGSSSSSSCTAVMDLALASPPSAFEVACLWR
jgi:hypothetical protein